MGDAPDERLLLSAAPEASARRNAAYRRIAALAVAVPIFCCAGTPPATLGLHGGRLAACPSSPNCVSSDAEDPTHAVPAFALSRPADEAWRAARAAVERLPRTRVTAATAEYLHAECRSALFGFVDDLELSLRASEGIIAVRSASRLGYGDMGVNRRRVERLRALLTSAPGGGRT
jgi:uncharacterized protein (DUF1499 family)